MEDCEKALERLYDYLDGELTDREIGTIAAHLELCKPCLGRFEFEKILKKIIGSVLKEFPEKTKVFHGGEK